MYLGLVGTRVLLPYKAVTPQSSRAWSGFCSSHFSKSWHGRFFITLLGGLCPLPMGQTSHQPLLLSVCFGFMVVTLGLSSSEAHMHVEQHLTPHLSIRWGD